MDRQVCFFLRLTGKREASSGVKYRFFFPKVLQQTGREKHPSQQPSKHATQSPLSFLWFTVTCFLPAK